MNSTLMSKTNAAYTILQQYKKPLNVRQIVKIALDRGMIEVNGKTPESTLASDLLQENRRRGKQNKSLRFLKVSPGTWTIADNG